MKHKKILLCGIALLSIAGISIIGYRALDKTQSTEEADTSATEMKADNEEDGMITLHKEVSPVSVVKDYEDVDNGEGALVKEESPLSDMK